MFMEPGESSGRKPSEEFWAKLVPSDSSFSDVEIRSNEMVISSETRSSSLEKYEWCKITRGPDLCSATVQNKSLEAIVVDGTIVQSEDATVIKCGSEITPGPDKGYLRYKFEIMPLEDRCSERFQVSVDIDHAKCIICLNIWHDAVTAAPCLHNFCNGCFSEWLRRSQKKQSNVLCPHCRVAVHFVGRNHFLCNIAEDILRSHPSLRRSNEEIAQLNSYASIKSNLVIGSRKGSRLKRARSPLGEESELVERPELPCPQCATVVGNFCCSPTTIHLQCQACTGMMPCRSDIGVPQFCLGCDRSFCGAYWHSQGVGQIDSHPICSYDSFKPISERTISIIPPSAHESNMFEQEVTQLCIRQTKKTLPDVIAEWVVKFDNREIDRARLQLKHSETITGGTHLCNECYDKFISFVLYWFRIAESFQLPLEIRKRPDCWYGYACRTQHHSGEHARKRNHVCRPTRGRDI